MGIACTELPPGASAYINGPLAWQTTGSGTELTFPVGKAAYATPYKPVYLLPATAFGTTTYTAEFFGSNPASAYNQPFLGGAAPVTVYWNVSKSGSGTARMAFDYTAHTQAADWAFEGGTTTTVPLLIPSM